MDRQSEAFRHATDADQWDGQLETLDFELVHGPISDVTQIYGPEYFEQSDDRDGWDIGREGPKDVREAQVALDDRIADPEAPDGDDVVLAYFGTDVTDTQFTQLPDPDPTQEDWIWGGGLR